MPTAISAATARSSHGLNLIRSDILLPVAFGLRHMSATAAEASRRVFRAGSIPT
jgi:hypothetical protein